MKKIIALMGQKGSGKDTAAKAFIDQGYEGFAFADPIKRYIERTFNIPYDILNNRRLKETVLEEHWCDLSPRRLMQLVGDAFRLHDKNYWVDLTEQLIIKCESPVVVTDLRYPNEYDMIRKHNGTIYKVTRDTGLVDTHDSEIYIDVMQADHELTNDFGTARDFIRYVEKRIMI